MSFFKKMVDPPLPAARRLDFYPLEERVLLDGDAIEGIDDVDIALDDALLADWFGGDEADIDLAADPPTIGQTDQDSPELTRERGGAEGSTEAEGQTPASTVAARTEVIFVDAAVDSPESLLSGLRADGDAATDWLIVYLDGESDGVEQITETLKTLDDIDAVHLLSHGDGTGIQLGNSTLGADSASGYARDLASWSNALNVDADLLIYGCDLASTADGRALVEMLAAVTDADVAASDDLTGHEVLDGDWILEYAVGSIETELAFSEDARQDWAFVLNTAPVVTRTDSNVIYTENAGPVYDPGITVTDPDSADFDGGTYTASILANGTANDRLEIRNMGTGAEEISVSGLDVLYEGTTIGTFSGGSDGATPLVVNLNSNASVSAVQALARATTYANVSENPTATDRTVGITVSDGDGGTSASSDVTIAVVPVNDAPTINSNGGGSTASVKVFENDTSVTTVTATDADAETDPISYSLSGGADTGHFIIDASSGLLTFATAPDFEAPIDSDMDNVYDVEVTADDGNGGADSQAISITIDDVNEAPVAVDLAGDSLIYGPGDGAVIVEQGADVVVSDVDSANFDGGSLTISLFVGSDPTEDVLSIRNQGTDPGQIGFDGSNLFYGGVQIGTAGGGGGGADLIVAFNANATPAAVTALIKNITYENIDTVSPTTGARGVRFALSDGDDASINQYDTTVEVISTADVLDRFDSIAYSNNDGTANWMSNWIESDGQGGDFSSGRIAVSTGRLSFQVSEIGDNIYRDADLSMASNATLTFDYGNSLGGAAALHVQISSNGGGYDTVSVYSGSIKLGTGSESIDISSHLFADARLRFYVDDGETGASNNKFWADNIRIEYSTSNEPVLSLPGSAVNYQEDDLPTIIDPTAVVSGTGLSDFDTGTLTVDFTAGSTANDRLSVRNEGTAVGQVGVSGSNVTYSGVTVGSFSGGTDGSTPLVVTFNASADASSVEAVARNVTYENTSDNPSITTRTVRFLLTDGDGGTSNAMTESIYVTSVNDAPTTVDHILTMNEDTPHVFTAADFAFDDVDGDTLTNVQMTRLESAGDLQLSGADVALNQVISRADIDAGNLIFTAAADANGASYDSFQYRVSDGTVYSEAASITTHVDASFDADPEGFTYTDLVNGSWASGTYMGAGGETGGGLRVALGGGATMGATSGAWAQSFTLTETTEITIATDYRLFMSSEYEWDEYGELFLRINGVDFGNDTNDSLVYQAGDGNGGSNYDSGWQTYQTTLMLDAGTHSLQLVANNSNSTDADEWVAGYFDNVNVTANHYNALPMDITAGNDAPVLDNFGAPFFSSTAENQSNSAGDTVASLVLDGSITDADGAAVEAIAVTAVDDTNGTWEYSLNDGSTWTAFSTPSDSAAILLGPTDRIRFIPDSGFDGTVATGVTYRAWDQSSGSAGDTVDTTSNGGSTAFSTDTETASITIVANGYEFWFSTSGDENKTDWNGIAKVRRGEVIAFGDPDMRLEPDTTSGTFSRVFNSAAAAADGSADLDALHRLSRQITVGSGANTVELLTGDILFSTKDAETFTSNNSLSVTADEIILFRPDTVDDFSAGTFTTLLDDFGTLHGGGDTRSLTLVEETTAFGDTTLNAGSFLFSRQGAAEENDIYLFDPTGVGAGTTAGTVSVLIDGADINNGSQIFGLELIEEAVTVGGTTLTAGQLLVTLDGDENSLGSNNSAVKKHDVFYLDVSQTTMESGTASASATLLLEGADVNIDSASEVTDALALVNTNRRPALDFPGPSLNYTEGDGSVVLDPGATVEDPDSADLDGGTLRAEITVAGTANDRLTIQHQGTGVGEVGISGSNVTYEGTTVGSFIGGSSGSDPLVILFNSNATATVAQAVARSIAYENVTDNPSTTSRTVEFVLTDGDGGISTTVSQDINITAVNDMPMITSNGGGDTAAVTILENSTAITTLTSSDADGGVPTYSITGGADAAQFAINGSTGELTFVAAPDAETPLDADADNLYEVVIEVSDGAGGTDAQTLSVSVEDVDEFDVGPLTDADAAADTVGEDAAVGNSVGITASASDADATTSTITYTLDDNAGGLFAVDENSGVVTVAGALDYETATSHSIIVRGTSADGSSSTQSFTITVTDVNESGVTAISDSDAAADAISENAADGTVVGMTASADDGDGTDTVSYSLDDDAGGRFAIDPNTGVVTVAGAIDREAAATHDITVRATSTDSSTTTKSFTIAITPVNDNDPNITSDGGGVNASVNVFENDVYVTSVAATDADLPAGTLTCSIVGGDDATQFTIDGNSGVLSFVARPNFESPADVGANNIYDVIVQASDGTRIDTQSIAVTVMDVADDGQFLDLFNADSYSNSDGTEAWTTSWVESEGDGSSIGNVKIAADKLRIMADTVNDDIYREADLSNAVTANVSFSYANSLQNTQSIIFQVSGDGGANYTTLTTFDATTNFGTDELAIDISSYVAADTRVRFLVDGVGGAVENIAIDNFQIEYFQNSPPTITSNGGGASSSISMAENTTAVTTVTAVDDDAPAQILDYTIVGGADSAQFSIDSGSGALTLIVVPDFESPTDSDGDNIYNVIVEVSDGVATDSQAVAVTITDVNEHDVTAATDQDPTPNEVDENASTGTTVGVTASASDADATTNSVSYSLSDDAGGRFAVDVNTGVVTVADGTLFDRESAASHNVIVRATGADGSTADTTFTINLNDVDEFDVGAVTDVDATTDTVAEDAAVGTSAGITAIASDVDATTNTITYTLDDDAGGLFAVDENSGAVTVASALDYETATSHSITVRGTSADGSVSTQSFTIEVTDVNESGVTAVNDTDAAADTVLENAADGTVVGVTAFADDNDSTDTVTYSLDDDAGGRFAIDSNTGVVTVAGVIDREAAATYNITVRATSTDSSTTTKSFTISVGDVDEFDVGPVPDVDATTDIVAEDAAVGNSVGITASASDADATTNTITYTLDDDAGGLFAVDGNSGVVTVAGPLDYETATSHAITIRGTSDDGSSSTKSFTITVTDVSGSGVTAISDSDATPDTVLENAANGTAVGITSFAEDVDGTDAVTYSLDDDAGGRFAVDANSGVITVAGAIDREASGSYNITVRATSSESSTITRTFTINIGDVDEFDVTTPTDSDVAANAVDENAANGTTVGITGAASDADATTDTITYTLDDDAGGLFAIDGNSGVVSVAGALDYETATSHSITIRATSSDSSTTTKSFTISVNDLNDNAPLIISNRLHVVEGQRVTLTLADLNASDADSSQLRFTVSGISGGQFEHAAAEGLAIQSFNLSEVAAGEISFIHDGSENPPAYAVTAHDPDWTTDPSAASITLTSVNDTPTIVLPPALVAYTENAAPQLIAPTAVVSDSDDAFLTSLTVELVGFQVDEDRLVLLSSTDLATHWDTATGRFTFSGTVEVAEYESALQSLAYENTSEVPSTHARTLHVIGSDGQLDSEVALRGVQVFAVNDAPAATNDAYSIRAGEFVHDSSPGVLHNDSDVDSDGLMTFLVSPPSSGQVILSSNGQLSYIPQPGFFGTDVIRYRVSDGAASSEVAEIQVEVVAVGAGQGAGGASGTPALRTSSDPVSQKDADSSTQSQQSDTSQTESESTSEEEQTSDQSRGVAAAGILPTPGQALSPAWMQIADVTSDSDGAEENARAAKILTGSINSGEAYRGSLGGTDSAAGIGSRLEYELMQEMLRAEVRNSIVWTQWDQRREETMEGYVANSYTIGAVGASAGMASVGYAMWAIRGGAFAATMFSSVPTWRLLDPAVLLKAYRNNSPEDSQALQDLLR